MNGRKLWIRNAALWSLLLFLSVIWLRPATVHAAGWLDAVQQQPITLGTAVTGSIKDGDYQGLTESTSYSSKGVNTYWHIYRFTMPKEGLLNISLESASEAYLKYYHYGGADGFVIFSSADPDEILWRSMYGQNEIKKTFSASRAVYYGSTEIALKQGEYYFAVRQKKTNDVPYQLTLRYKEPVIHITSISLNPSSMTLEPGEQRTIGATVFPDNATDQTITWKSSNPSIATVDGGRVTAVSTGTVSIVASSADGEISETCAVTVRCNHVDRVTVTPAGIGKEGRITRKCIKCGEEQPDQTIAAIGTVQLSRTSCIYNGKAQQPAVSVKDVQGKKLVKNKDYTISYSGGKNVGVYTATIKFKGNYKGTVNRKFTISPQSTKITKVKSRHKGFSLSWKKQSNQISGYEIAYCANRKFSKKSTTIVTAGKGKSAKTISKLEKQKKYYVKIRTYKDVKVKGKTIRLYSAWSKVKNVTTKK